MRWIAGQSGDRGAAHLWWLAGAMLLGFLVSLGPVRLAALSRDGFVLVHLVVTGAFVTLYARRAGFGPAELRANWPLGLALGGLAAAFAAGFVVSQPGSPGPQGLGRVASVLWLGLGYGLIDALLLSVLPVHAVWSAARGLGWLRRWPGRAGAAALSMAASLAVTATYHPGFPEFQGPEIVRPVIGNVVFSAAYVLSGSPLAPILSHVALHVAAVVHAYGTSVPLPPHY